MQIAESDDDDDLPSVEADDDGLTDKAEDNNNGAPTLLQHWPAVHPHCRSMLATPAQGKHAG